MRNAPVEVDVTVKLNILTYVKIKDIDFVLRGGYGGCLSWTRGELNGALLVVVAIVIDEFVVLWL